MINITYNGSINDLKTATQKANNLFNDPQFLQEIVNKGRFDKATIDAGQIVDCIKKSKMQARVVTYRSPRRSVYGYDDPNNPDLLHINLWRNEWNIGSLVNTIVHEAIHAVNSEFPKYSFGHGDNSSVGKGNTAPYWIGALAETKTNAGRNLRGAKVKTNLIKLELSPEEEFKTLKKRLVQP